MRRREFLRTGTAAGLGAWVGLTQFGGRTVQAKRPFHMSAVLPSDFPQDSYQAPDWLRYCRTVYFDGYSPPVYPHLKDFDARRLLETVVDVGGNVLRFQPIGYWACYPSKVFPVHPELEGRDLVDEVAKECRVCRGSSILLHRLRGTNYADGRLHRQIPDVRRLGLT
jgi:hypothetical protein